MLAAPIAASLISCATTPSAPIAPAPICSSDADCTVKWAAARTYVLQNTAYKIQTYSPDFMQTFNPGPGDAALAATVNKAPQPNGTYAIVATFFCNNMFGCVPSASLVLDGFNRYVAGVGNASEAH
ncbi:MAG TPA: hypothetical protein VGF89_01150 [Steroidobacteraceae bacterium]|jgi:hypothetical protein